MLDGSVRRTGGGRVLVGGSPLTLLRLTAAGAMLLDQVQSGEPVVATPATALLLDRLLDTGVIHPLQEVGSGPSSADVTVVVPAYGASVASLGTIVNGCPGVAAVVVVDDASPVAIGAVEGAQVVRRSVNGGPGAARSTGLGHVCTPFVAFIDADVDVHAGWLDGLLGHFADDAVALVAPRVASVLGGTLLARYEAVRSPLDLGTEPARVRAGTRVSYVPSATMICRVEALGSIDGFDHGLRFGEDVDLVWRLDEAGWRIRYEPTVVVHHEPRPSWRAWVNQRFRYGSSAGPLASRHPGALAPVRVSRWSALSWFASAAGWPVIGGAVAAVTTAMLARKLRAVPDGARVALRLAGLGHLYAGRSLASGLTRAWWPLAALAAVVSKRCRRVVLAAAVVPSAIDWVSTRPALDPARYVALRVLDDLCYGAGLAAGAVRERSIDALRPDFTSWPNRPARRPAMSPKPPMPSEPPNPPNPPNPPTSPTSPYPTPQQDGR